MKQCKLSLTLKKYCKQRIKQLSLFIGASLIFAGVFYIYSLPLEPVLYSFIICFSILLLLLLVDFYFFNKKHCMLVSISSDIKSMFLSTLPPSSSLIEEDYIEIINRLISYCEQLSNSSELSRKNLLEYFTLWVHQIKTPISAMDLLLQEKEQLENQHIKAELFKIDQYVTLAISYLKLDGSTTDYKIAFYSIDSIIKAAVRKYSTIFITKKIKLSYTELDFKVLTDEKWLIFVIEQLLSNALKYTNSGTITITSQAPKILIIKDDGIGISPEDLPRIFEMGFVGYNGRIEKKSTGIGLYICKKALDKLTHSINIDSQPGLGTTVKLYLDNAEQITD